MRWAAVACALAASAATACSAEGEASVGGSIFVGVGEPSADAGAADSARPAPDAGHDALPPALPPLLLFNLRAAPFPNSGHPDVAVHVPNGFDPWNHPGMLVFFHGFDNCVANVVGSTDTPCTPDAGARSAMHLIDQVDTSRVNAILVAVQLRYDQATGDPGQLTKAGDFHALLHELLTEHLTMLLGVPLDVPDFDPIVVGSHSGGYEAAAAVLQYGQVSQVREIDLYDSLYGETAVFDPWVQSNVMRFDPARADALRWMDVYTSSGGTAANSRAMASAAEGWFAEAGAPNDVLFDDTTDTLTPGAYAHPALFKLTSLAHADVPKYYFQQFARASFFTTIP